ncbi:MAG: hypothetical protein HFH87_01740 [Lachnospiraceae bacterium]|nr:hypothetical protein [Lachnospiraceae bacterium]
MRTRGQVTNPIVGFEGKSRPYGNVEEKRSIGRKQRRSGKKQRKWDSDTGAKSREREGEDSCMWCAVHVKDGNEARTEAFVSGLLSKEMNARCFHLTRSRRKKYGGQWRTVRENLLPGYVFIDTDRPEEVGRELKGTSGLQLLFGSAAFVTTVKAQESEFMELLMDEEGEIGLSEVRVEENGGIRCVSGPLRKVSHLVRRVDLHKRIAEVEAEFMGKRQVLYLGIEIADEASGREQERMAL